MPHVANVLGYAPQAVKVRHTRCLATSKQLWLGCGYHHWDVETLFSAQQTSEAKLYSITDHDVNKISQARS
jgi:hypothetical protein